jgi:hypothetical protein
MINFTKIKNDINGNPRYVCHFLSLLTEVESYDQNLTINEKYDLAVMKAKKIGGRRYHNKSYGGGIVFQSFNIGETEKEIINLTK